MKRLFLVALTISATFLFACTGNSNSDSTNSDDVLPSALDTSGMPMTDFSKEVALESLMEVQLGNIAVINGGNERIKNFGTMMVVDFKKINEDLKYPASKENLNLPTSISDDQQKNIDTLRKQIGKDFDKYYVPMTIKNLEDDIAAFKAAGIKISDVGYKSFISNALPILEKDLDAIESIKEEM